MADHAEQLKAFIELAAIELVQRYKVQTGRELHLAICATEYGIPEMFIVHNGPQDDTVDLLELGIDSVEHGTPERPLGRSH